MTEKRFQYNVNKNSIEYDGKHFAYCNVEQNKIANKLNELAEENITIKKTLHTIINQINMDKINNNKVVYSARILFKEKEFQFIYDTYKKSLEEL